MPNVLQALPRCYDSGIAYIYASDTAVYEVCQSISLAINSNPLLVRFHYNMTLLMSNISLQFSGEMLISFLTTLIAKEVVGILLIALWWLS